MLELLGNALFLALAAVTIIEWWTRRRRGSTFLVVSFVALAIVSILGNVLPTDLAAMSPTQVQLARLALFLVVVALWSLYRFVGGQLETGALAWRLLDPWVAVMAAWGLFVDLADPSAAFSVTLLALCISLPGTTAIMLFAGRSSQATIARRRIRLLGLAGIALSVTVVVSPLRSDPGDGASLAVEIVELAAAVLFLLALRPPARLRAAWRGAQELHIHQALIDMLVAEHEEDVARAVLPRVAATIGVESVAYVPASGGEPVFHSADGVPLGRATDRVDSVLVIPLAQGRLVARVGPFAPFFGVDDTLVMEHVAPLIDVALHRSRRLGAERLARRRAVEARDELSEAKERLEGAHEDLQMLSAAMSHDLKTPLTSIIGFAHTIGVVEPRLEPRTRDFLRRVVDNAEYMAEMIDQMSHIARLGTEQAKQEVINLELLTRLIAADAVARYPGMTVHVEEIPPVRIDPIHARRLMENLIRNAAKYGGNEVAVRIAPAPGLPARGFVDIDVIDDGPGIDADYLDKVFERFERAGANGPGSGLGLAICRRIAEVSGGSIRAVASDSGARIRISLPVAPGTPAPGEASMQPEGSAA